jgi:hypothetical protein
MLSAAAYPAYARAWQMEELLMEEPDLNKLASCIALLRVRGWPEGASGWVGGASFSRSRHGRCLATAAC